ncbi:DUF6081 family protein [Streptomyces sp. NPDC086023]|uniref:DUF6081 family protein n=1 Tax=Streptomyces sp. NPDC086023 TaxID=3365746 RepID=UPI0037D8F707
MARRTTRTPSAFRIRRTPAGLRGAAGAAFAAAVSAVAMTAALLPATAAVAEESDGLAAPRRVLFRDDFTAGFANSGAGAKWSTPFTDGVVTTSAAGLKVVPSGTDPATGQPAFQWTTGQQSAGGMGTLDHIKWASMTTHTASTGLAGFDTPAAGTLSCATTLSATGTGMGAHPFGAAVSDAEADPRLGSGALLFTDPESNVVFDFFVTNKKIYAVYERLRKPGTTYAAYSYAVPVASRTSTSTDTLKISVNRANASVTWTVNGANVLSVWGIGNRVPDRRYMTLDHGGTEETVRPRQLNCGLGTFTLLDGATGADGKGLVKIDSTVDYFNPRQGAPAAQTFVDGAGLAGNRLWGQGVQLRVGSVEVTSS